MALRLDSQGLEGRRTWFGVVILGLHQKRHYTRSQARYNGQRGNFHGQEHKILCMYGVAILSPCSI